MSSHRCRLTNKSIVLFAAQLLAGLYSDGAAVPTAVPGASVTMPVVDLDYAVYAGYRNETSGLNIFKGIRYAVADRWSRPRLPASDRTSVLTLGTSFRPRCPQTPQAPAPAGEYNLTAKALGTEDCLFLSIFTPARPTNSTPCTSKRGLPVLVWIHGGGYGTGQGNYDFSDLISNNDQGFIFVGIQYRLGAFGFLSSADMVAGQGLLNAGLWDMEFALQWVKKYAARFGGDPGRVTIAGESAGAGGVMTLSMARGGTQGTGLFRNAIVASPYLPQQYAFDDARPTEAYYAFAGKAGCLGDGRASAAVSMAGTYGQWTFLPVTDGEFLTGRPSVQLLSGQVNGLNMLSGNNANEGVIFVPTHIQTEADFDAWLRTLLPLMDEAQLAKVKTLYAIAPVVQGAPRFSTLGDRGPTALNQSEFAIGQQQRAANLYSELTFVCPSYWLAAGYSAPSSRARGSGNNEKSGRRSWKYQFSVPPSEHGGDLDAYDVPNREVLGLGTMSDVFRLGVQKLWGRLIIYDDPTLPPEVVRQLAASTSSANNNDIRAGETGTWPEWDGHAMLNLNMTGGKPVQVVETFADGTKENVTQYSGPGAKADWEVVDAYSWEGGRGERCEFWAEMGAYVPE